MSGPIRTKTIPKNMEVKRTYTVRLPYSFVSQLDQMIESGACGSYLNRSEFIETALRHYINCNGAADNE